jgi:hypothetical protein
MKNEENEIRKGERSTIEIKIPGKRRWSQEMVMKEAVVIFEGG